MKLKMLTFLFVFFILSVIILADTGNLGFLSVIYKFPHGDKAGHFILYGILTFLLNLFSLRSFRNRKPIRVAVAVTLLLALAIGLEEWSQTLFSQRTADWVDLLFSYLGVGMGAGGAWGAWRLRRMDG